MRRGARLLAIAVGLAAGCSSEPTSGSGLEEPAPIAGLASGSSCPPTSTLTYANFGREFLAEFCVRCHSRAQTGPSRLAPLHRDLDELTDVRGLVFQIDQQAAAGPRSIHTTMPPGAPLPTLEQRHLLGEWLACGARGGVPATRDTGSVGYALEHSAAGSAAR